MSETPPLSPIPGALNQLSSPAGYHRRGIKAIGFGESGGGKSWLIASMPRPLAVIDCGAESGVQPYLRACKLDENGRPIIDLARVARGEEDVCFTVTTPAEYKVALDWIIANQEILNSVGIDGFTNAWGDHMDWWQDELGKEQIQGGDWRKVKGPWKANLKTLMKSRLNVVFTAQLRDLEYRKADAGPGVEGKLEIIPIELPAIEKNTPYVVDVVLQLGIVRDDKNRPTKKHFAMLTKGRRPLSIDPKSFYVGKKWYFDETAPTNPWEAIITPVYKGVDDKMGIDYLGMEAADVRDAEEEMRRAADDTLSGALLRLLNGTDFKSLQELKGFWDREIAGQIDTLDAVSRRGILTRKDELKAELTAKAKGE